MKLVTWNTQWCCGLDGVVSPRRIVERARALADFDVLCLQEIADHYPGLRGCPDHDQSELIAALPPGFQLFFGAAVDEWNEAGRIQLPFTIAGGAKEAPQRQRLWDSWRLVHGKAPHPPTFCVHDRSYSPRPIACDFVFVSNSLKDKVRGIHVDGESQVSDHQPVVVESG